MMAGRSSWTTRSERAASTMAQRPLQRRGAFYAWEGIVIASVQRTAWMLPSSGAAVQYGRRLAFRMMDDGPMPVQRRYRCARARGSRTMCIGQSASAPAGVSLSYSGSSRFLVSSSARRGGPCFAAFALPESTRSGSLHGSGMLSVASWHAQDGVVWVCFLSPLTRPYNICDTWRDRPLELVSRTECHRRGLFGPSAATQRPRCLCAAPLPCWRPQALIAALSHTGRAHRDRPAPAGSGCSTTQLGNSGESMPDCIAAATAP